MMRTKQLTQRPVEYYLGLSYPVTLYPDPTGGFTAEIKDLPGCLTQGETADEAMENIQDAKALWIETTYDDGKEIPVPSTDEQYSGKLLLRISRSLHRKLAEQAEQEGVSLNSHLGILLTESYQLKQDLLVISGLILRRNKKMAINCNGTKQGGAIILPEELQQCLDAMIPDGAETPIEITLPMTEEDREKLDEIAGKYVDDGELEKVLAEIYRLRDANVGTYDKIANGD